MGYLLTIIGLLLANCVAYCVHGAVTGGMLFPQDSESRETKLLDGIWEFRADNSTSRNLGFEQKWYNSSLQKTGVVRAMPVPSSYNDITTEKWLRDFVGWVWYERQFFAPASWQHRRIVLRLDSAHYTANVWVNGQNVMNHSGGHLPFKVEVTKYLSFSSRNRVTVAVNNTLTPHSLPPGAVEYKTDTNKYPAGYFIQTFQFDFFNYAGIHRHVWLYATPTTFIDDVTIRTDVSGTTGVVRYQVGVAGAEAAGARVEVVVEDEAGVHVASAAGLAADVKVPDARLWWPHDMGHPHRYTLVITLETGSGQRDVYRQKFGIRTVKVTAKQMLINDKPFYCRGMGKHEDSDIRGKGLDLPLIIRDFELIMWLGANCFRSSHYPYAEEILEMADRYGVAVIDESPAVGIHTEENLSNVTLAHHLEVESEHVRRDKNRASVVMWSVANEPTSNMAPAEYYFKTVLEHVRKLDPTRPATFVAGPTEYFNDRAMQYADVLCINRYYGWYSDTGHTEVIGHHLPYDLGQWHAKFGRPMIVTEYGADTIPGLHQLPSFVFTEDYQRDFLQQYHAVFDDLRRDFLVGEMIWNFADFMTGEAVTRVVGNKKGIFTRQRQPKAAAWTLRDRYRTLPPLQPQPGL